MSVPTLFSDAVCYRLIKARAENIAFCHKAGRHRSCYY